MPPSDLMMIGFPSKAHYSGIRKSLRSRSYSGLTDTERWQYHAYDYAWRRTFLGNADEAASPIDPDRSWYDEASAAAAQRFFKR